MDKPTLDFLSEEDKIIEPPKGRLNPISRTLLSILIVFVIAGISFSIGVLSSGERFAHTFGDVGLFGQLKNLLGNGDKTLKGETDDRINILLLGVGGAGHDGPNLSDTIMVASFKPSTKQAALISLPRDLVTNIPGYGSRKINNANAFGEEAGAGQGAQLAEQTVSQALGIPIHYYVRVDFDGFKDIVDSIGGITVDVENTFDDYSYPVNGEEDSLANRYEHLHIEKGVQHMDGTLALKYARSRHAAGVEGSDFARAKRQQKVLVAIKNKVLSIDTLINPIRITQLMNSLSSHVSSDLQVWEILKLYNLGQGVSESSIAHLGFNDGPGGMLYATTGEDGAYILLPRAGNFSQIQEATRTVFDSNNPVQKDLPIPASANVHSATTTIKTNANSTTTTTTTATTTTTIETPLNVEIQNGTKIAGLAQRTADELTKSGYTITRIKNAPTRDYTQTVVYNMRGAKNKEIAAKIARLLKAQVAPGIPSWITDTSTNAVSSAADILIILGTDRTTL